MRLPISIALLWICACSRPTQVQERTADGRLRLVFIHQPLWGDPKTFNALLDAFRAQNPGLALETQLLPNDSDVAHQYFVTAMEGGSKDFDLMTADVVWVPEFARAGWLMDLTDSFPPEALEAEFLPGPVAAVTFAGRTWAVPWYVDVGLLYFRSDLVPTAPRTFRELEASIAVARKKDPSLEGYLWQGRQYEGLVCNVYEAIWGFGGKSLLGHRLVLHSDAALQALQWLRHLITSGLSPAAVTSAGEEESRRAFQNGRAVFMRNWPYAWAEMQVVGSPVRGRIEVAPLPSSTGEPGFGALGGWQLAVNAHASADRREAAKLLLRHLTSPKANLAMAIAYGRNPARRAAYEDARIQARAPYISRLLSLVLRARPRPVTPYYGLLSDALQSEFSAAVSGIRPPQEALARAQAQADRIIGEAP